MVARRWRSFGTLAVATICLAGSFERDLHAAPPNPAATDIAESVTAFVRAFNAHDTVALSILWSDKCVYRSELTGQEHTGRQAVVNAYGALFKQDPKSSLSLHVESLKFESADKATLVCVATLKHDQVLSTRSRVAAQFVRYGQSWLFERIDEVDLPPAAAQGLQALSWLAGTWAADSPGGRLLSQFQWAPGNAFLVRTYWKEGAARKKIDGPSNQGTQHFGWDAQQRSIHTWLFDSLGAFGEGDWQSDGPSRWVNKLALQMPDGRGGSLTQVLVKLGDNQMTLQMIDCEIGGVERPDGPIVTMVRLPGSSVRPPASSTAAVGSSR